MKSRISKLNDGQAIYVLKKLIKRWLDKRGFEAYSIVSNAQYKSGIFLHKLPDSLSADKAINPRLGRISRFALETIISGNDNETIGWANEILDEIEESKAQCLDPISLGIIGATIIGLVLAARIKNIGSIEFYEGVPNEVADLVKAASSIFKPED